MMDDAREKIRQEHEAAAIASLDKNYSPEIAKYLANPNREGMQCYLAASAHWSAWSGMPKAEFLACDTVVRQAIIAIREKDATTIAVEKAERAERRKGLSEVAAKLDEIDERQEAREREMDRRDAVRQAAVDADAAAKAKTEALNDELTRAKRFACSMGNRKDC